MEQQVELTILNILILIKILVFFPSREFFSNDKHKPAQK